MKLGRHLTQETCRETLGVAIHPFFHPFSAALANQVTDGTFDTNCQSSVGEFHGRH